MVSDSTYEALKSEHSFTIFLRELLEGRINRNAFRRTPAEHTGSWKLPQRSFPSYGVSA